MHRRIEGVRPYPYPAPVSRASMITEQGGFAFTVGDPLPVPAERLHVAAAVPTRRRMPASSDATGRAGRRPLPSGESLPRAVSPARLPHYEKADQPDIEQIEQDAGT